jgi:hypothetical protein
MDFVNPLGAIASGRDAMALTGSIAIVDLTIDLTGYEGMLPGGLVEWRPGVVRTRSRMIVQRFEGTWKIRASQLTAVQPFLPN